MSAARRATERKKASGANIENWQRHTVQVLLRMSPEDASLMRERAAAEEMTLADYVARLVRGDARVA